MSPTLTSLFLILVSTTSSHAKNAADKLAYGSEHFCALRNGTVHCWGQSSWGKLGDGNSSNAAYTVDETKPKTPKGLESGISDLATDNGSSCAVIKKSLKCWGSNGQGILAIDPTSKDFSPVPFWINDSDGDRLTGVRSVHMTKGASQACVLLDGGEIKCWGNSTWGRLGNGAPAHNSTPVYAPTEVLDETGKPISGATQVALGDLRSCAVVKGLLKCWGVHAHTQSHFASALAHNAWANVAKPETRIARDPDMVVSSGGPYVCVASKGTLRCFGMQKYDGQNPVPDAPIVSIPVVISQKGSTEKASAESACHDPSTTAPLDSQQSKLANALCKPSNPISKLQISNRSGCAVIDKGVQCWPMNDEYLIHGKSYKKAAYKPAGMDKGVVSIEFKLASSTYTICALFENGTTSCQALDKNLESWFK